MFRPRPYISFSQMTTFEMSEKKFIEQYIKGYKQRISRNMAYGSSFAQGLEDDELTGDPMLDIMMTKMPQLGINDKVIQCVGGIDVLYERRGKSETMQVPFILQGKEKIPLLAIPDTASPDYKQFKEYKTSVAKWTQKRADDSGQITFYVTAIYLAFGFIPEDIELVNVIVDYQSDGSLQPTGEMLKFKTTRSMVDVIKMISRIKKAWKQIGEVSQREMF